MPRRPQISREKILEAALEMVDQEGLEGLSMRKLAAKLKVEAMSLYNHVKDKEDLLNGLVNLVLSRIEQPKEALPWPELLEYFALSLYQTFLQHRALVPVFGRLDSGGIYGLDAHVMQGMERVLRALSESGLSPEHQVNAFRGLLALVLGFVLAHTQGLSTSKAEAEALWAQWDSQRYLSVQAPALAKLAPVFFQTHADDDFRFMLQIYLEALKAKSR